MAIAHLVSICLSSFGVCGAFKEGCDFELLLEDRECLIAREGQGGRGLLAIGEFLLEGMGGILEKEEVKTDVRAKRKITDFKSFKFEQVGRRTAPFPFLDVLLDAVIRL